MVHRFKAWGFTTFLAILSATSVVRAETIRVIFLHLNDVYEITPVEGGKRGGLARVATLRRLLLEANPNTFTLLGGDFLSPSALGTASVDGERLAGAQVVATFNTLGLDYTIFGNHEFDVSEEQLLARLDESDFQWISGNVTQADGSLFPNTIPSTILTVPGETGDVLRIGLVGTTITSNLQDYVQYADPIESLQRQTAEIEDEVDITVALTHLSLAEDQQVATNIPEIDLILGGHEHENIQQWRFDLVSDQPAECVEQPTPILKADANARTVYIVNLLYDTETNCFQIIADLRPITDELEDDPATAETVNAWLERGFEGFRANGFEPSELITMVSEPLDGLESSVRNQPTGLTDLIAKAMIEASANDASSPAELAIFNSGSIRIDDVIPPGQITQYDVIRILPFGGNILTIDMSGELLAQVLIQGQANQGTGGYLQSANVAWDETTAQWLIQGESLESNQTYRVAINDFLLSGRETGLDYLTLNAEGVSLVNEGEDIRIAVIQYLQATATAEP